MTEDFTLFFDTTEFACLAVFTPAGGAAQPPANVIYDQNGAVLEQFGLQSSGPAAVCPATQWPAIAEGDALSITLPAGVKAFQVRVVTPLDDGALLLLTLAHA